MCGIYKITNVINGKSYIGQSTNIEKRWKKHRQPSSCKTNKVLYKAFEKYRIDNFTFEIIQECAPHELDRLEVMYIEEFNTFKNGYNRTLGGKGYLIDYDAYYKAKLEKIYTKSLDDIIVSFEPMYVTTNDSFDSDMFIYSKRELNKIKNCRRKSYGETFEKDVDFIEFNEENQNHLYKLRASVNRLLLENKRDLEYKHNHEGIFTDEEYVIISNLLQSNIDENEYFIENMIEYSEVDDCLFYDNRITPKDSICDLIPDYDELGGDEYFDGCF